MSKRYTYHRAAAHIEDIGAGRAGLFLTPGTHEGPEGWYRVRSDGAVQLECRSGAPYVQLPQCPTTGALILPQED